MPDTDQEFYYVKKKSNHNMSTKAGLKNEFINKVTLFNYHSTKKMIRHVLSRAFNFTATDL